MSFQTTRRAKTEAGKSDSRNAAMKTVTLSRAGGSITLTGNINLFELEGDERALVFDLIDKMKASEAKQGGGSD